MVRRPLWGLNARALPKMSLRCCTGPMLVLCQEWILGPLLLQVATGECDRMVPPSAISRWGAFYACRACVAAVNWISQAGFLSVPPPSSPLPCRQRLTPLCTSLQNCGAAGRRGPSPRSGATLRPLEPRGGTCGAARLCRLLCARPGPGRLSSRALCSVNCVRCPAFRCPLPPCPVHPSASCLPCPQLLGNQGAALPVPFRRRNKCLPSGGGGSLAWLGAQPLARASWHTMFRTMELPRWLERALRTSTFSSAWRGQEEGSANWQGLRFSDHSAPCIAL